MALKSIPAEGSEQPSAGGQEPQREITELNEDQTLALLQRPEVTAETLVSLARNPSAAKSRKLTLALTTHPRTPRHIALPMLRRLFTFDLMRVTLAPAVAADIKRAAEEQIMNRLESISAGEKMALARRASGRVAATLLGDPEARIIARALDNSRLVEALVVTELMKKNAPDTLFVAASKHPKWSQRREVQIALLRSEKTHVEQAREFASHFPEEFLRGIVPESRISAIVGSK